MRERSVRPEIEYLSVADVDAIYRAMMREMGLAPTALVREGSLESAVHRPRMMAHYAGASLVEQAVALGTGVALAHPWVDGNKRGAFRAMIVFLRINGIDPPSPKPAHYQKVAELLEQLVAAHEEVRDDVERGVVDELNRWAEASGSLDQNE